MKFYFTLDADGCDINESAEIFEYESENLEAFKAHILKKYQESYYLDPDENYRLYVDEGRFADCWIKTSHLPEATEDLDYLVHPFIFDQIYDYTSNPGHHNHWLTPREDVYVLMVMTSK